MKNLKYFLILIGFIVLISACKKDEPTEPAEDTPFKATPYVFDIPNHFPTIMNIPEDNPMTVEGVELGRYLFYDGRLAGREDEGLYMSCGTCHLQEYSFENGVGFGHGLPDSNGYSKPSPHVMLPMINLVWNHEGYLWNGMISKNNTNLGSAGYGVPAEPQFHMRNIESLVWMGIAAAHEMNSTVDASVNAIKNISIYPPMFEAAFGTPEINYDRIAKAIAQFIRTLVASDSKAHKVFRGDENFSDSERRGFNLFVTEQGADCFHCHGSEGAPLFTTHLFYNNAKDSFFSGIYDDPRDRYHITGNPTDLGAYKATTLINIEKTGPYMHDGRFKTLDDVINFYNSGLKWSPYADPLMHKLVPPYGNGAELTPFQIADLKAFLLTLTDEAFLTNPDFAKPAGLQY